VQGTIGVDVTTVRFLKLKGGTLQIDYNTTTGRHLVQFSVLEIDPDFLVYVPDANPYLLITQTMPA
jgi:hypothetical protein